jgi:hypothetical protein
VSRLFAISSETFERIRPSNGNKARPISHSRPICAYRTALRPPAPTSSAARYDRTTQPRPIRAAAAWKLTGGAPGRVTLRYPQQHDSRQHPILQQASDLAGNDDALAGVVQQVRQTVRHAG